MNADGPVQHHPHLCCLETVRFSVLEKEKDNNQQQQRYSSSLSFSSDLDLFFQDTPIFQLVDLLREQQSKQQQQQNNQRQRNHKNNNNNNNNNDDPASTSSSSSSSSLASCSFGQQLWKSLARHGFILLTCPMTSRPAQILQRLQTSLTCDLFPQKNTMNQRSNGTSNNNNNNTNNHDSSEQKQPERQRQRLTNPVNLTTSRRTYVSERGIPLYKLGYELTEDGVREIFRIAAGCPDDNDDHDDHVERLLFANQPRHVRTTWLQALGLMRHVTDATLDILLHVQQQQHAVLQQPQPSCWPLCRNKQRPYSGGSSWSYNRKASIQSTDGNHHDDNDNGTDDDDCYNNQNGCCLQERKGDFSVLYAMHYFNDNQHHNVSHLTSNDNTDDDPVESQHQQQTQHHLRKEYICSRTGRSKNLNSTQSHYYHTSSCPSSDSCKESSSTLSSSSLPSPQQTQVDGNGIPLAVKAHVDPSLLVMEPFLACPDYYYNKNNAITDNNAGDDESENNNNKDVVAGLQIWHEPTHRWWHVDGPNSILPPLLQRHFQQQQQQQKQHVMLLFCGKGLVEAMVRASPQALAAPATTKTNKAAATNGGTTTVVLLQQQQQQEAFQLLLPLQATLHRVVHGDCPRRTVIYEQKYEEFYPPPDFD